jgi:hypothetical protein
MQHKARIWEICIYVKWNRKHNSREKHIKVLHLKEKGEKEDHTIGTYIYTMYALNTLKKQKGNGCKCSLSVIY